MKGFYLKMRFRLAGKLTISEKTFKSYDSVITYLSGLDFPPQDVYIKYCYKENKNELNKKNQSIPI